MSVIASSIRERLLRTLDIIAAASRKSGRLPESVRLVVVTKMQPASVIRSAVEAGARILGENYAEEAKEKIATLASLGMPREIEWHMIGHVQSRKASIVAQHFTLVHSLDNIKLAKRLDICAAEIGHSLPTLLEFNVSGEKSKHGWAAWNEACWPELLTELNEITALSHLKVRGLMTMPPLSTDPETGRPYFQKLRHLRDFLRKQVPQAEWEELSMGTSVDFETAVEEGATLVRIGQAILGPRLSSEA